MQRRRDRRPSKSLIGTFMKKLVWIFAVLLLSALALRANAETNTLHDFTSDGCSMSPDGVVVLFSTAYVPCCVNHDMAYWQGGTKAEKLAADLILKECIKSKSNSFVAEIYYRGVRMGGGPNLPTSYHWGYGWEKKRGYRHLSQKERALAADKLSQIDWNEVYQSLGFDPQ